MSGVRFLHDDERFEVTYRDEHSLQESLKELAHAHGWVTESEVVVPGWGRIDLILHESHAKEFSWVIELKTDLTRLSTIRKAFQQADGYARWLATQGVNRRVVLAAAEVDFSLANDLAYGYRDSVQLVSAGMLVNTISEPGYSGARARAARSRRDSALRRYRLLHAAYSRAGAEYPSTGDSKKKPAAVTAGQDK